jgi:hypothetical protein
LEPTAVLLVSMSTAPPTTSIVSVMSPVLRVSRTEVSLPTYTVTADAEAVLNPLSDALTVYCPGMRLLAL